MHTSDNRQTFKCKACAHYVTYLIFRNLISGYCLISGTKISNLYIIGLPVRTVVSFIIPKKSWPQNLKWAFNEHLV